MKFRIDPPRAAGLAPSPGRPVPAEGLLAAALALLLGCSRAPEPGAVGGTPAASAPAPSSASAAALAQLDRPAPDFELLDARGRAVRLSSLRGRPVVLEWIDAACPYVRKWYASGHLPALQRKYTAAGVAWLSICSSAPGSAGAIDAANAQATIQELDLASTALLLDPQGQVARRYRASTALHCFVIDAGGKLVYSGALDDRPTTDPADVPTARNHVAIDLDALLTAKPVEPHRTTPYGTPLDLPR
jgi:peroxiredoxin